MSLAPIDKKTPRFYRSSHHIIMSVIHVKSEHAPKVRRLAIIPALRHGLTE
jgi:hypothetical protein